MTSTFRTVFPAAVALVACYLGRPAIADTGHSRQEVLKADLFIAITKHDDQAVKSALARGASSTERNWLNFSPLMHASANGVHATVDRLLAAKAQINDSSIYGSALTFAIMGRHEDLALHLLEKGADPNPTRVDNISTLMLAASNNQTRLLAKLLTRKPDVNAKDNDGANALVYAARYGHADCIKPLLAAGASIEASDSHGRTPLMEAAINGHAAAVDLLLQNKAKVNAVDKRSCTALNLCARYSGNETVFKSLIRSGADSKHADFSGKSPIQIAALRGYAWAGKPTASSKTEAETVNRAVGALQVSMSSFADHIKCGSCHHQGMGLFAVTTAGKHGFKIDPAVVGKTLNVIAGDGKETGKIIHAGLTDPNEAKFAPAMDIGDFAIGSSTIFNGMRSAGIPANPGFAELSQFLAKVQNANGSWDYATPREPLQSSYVTCTALTMQVMKAYGPKQAVDTSFAKAAKWLETVAAPNTEDKASRIIGLSLAEAGTNTMESAIKDLVNAQNPDGGWSQLPKQPSDAHATGIALYALAAHGGKFANQGAVKKAVEYLVRTQDEDGSWYVAKKASPWNTYFDAGFPHGASQYTSFNATCWAVAGLACAAGPEKVASR